MENKSSYVMEAIIHVLKQLNEEMREREPLTLRDRQKALNF